LGTPFFLIPISLAAICDSPLKWVFPGHISAALCFFKSIRQRGPYPAWQHVTIVAWTGMRGVVSLAAALALPFTVQNGAPFPGPRLVLFLTFIVILATLVLQG